MLFLNEAKCENDTRTLIINLILILAEIHPEKKHMLKKETRYIQYVPLLLFH